MDHDQDISSSLEITYSEEQLPTEKTENNAKDAMETEASSDAVEAINDDSAHDSEQEVDDRIRDSESEDAKTNDAKNKKQTKTWKKTPQKMTTPITKGGTCEPGKERTTRNY